jgi:hypothetical protein
MLRAFTIGVKHNDDWSHLFAVAQQQRPLTWKSFGAGCACSKALFPVLNACLMPSRDAAFLPLTASNRRASARGEGCRFKRVKGRSAATLDAIETAKNNRNKVLRERKVHQNRSQTSFWLQTIKGLFREYGLSRAAFQAPLKGRI